MCQAGSTNKDEAGIRERQSGKRKIRLDHEGPATLNQMGDGRLAAQQWECSPLRQNCHLCPRQLPMPMPPMQTQWHHTTKGHSWGH